MIITEETLEEIKEKIKKECQQFEGRRISWLLYDDINVVAHRILYTYDDKWYDQLEYSLEKDFHNKEVNIKLNLKHERNN